MFGRSYNVLCSIFSKLLQRVVEIILFYFILTRAMLVDFVIFKVVLKQIGRSIFIHAAVTDNRTEVDTATKTETETEIA